MGQFSRNMTKNVSIESFKSSRKNGGFYLIQDGCSRDDTAIVSFSQANLLKRSKSLPNINDNLGTTKEPTWLKHQSVGGFSASPLTCNEDNVVNRNDYQTAMDEVTEGSNSGASSPFAPKIVEFPVLSVTSLNVASSQSTIENENDDEPMTPTTPAAPESYPQLQEVGKDQSSVLCSEFSKNLSQAMNEEREIKNISRPPDLVIQNPSLSSESSRERYKQARCSPDIKKFFAPLNVTDTSTNTSHDVPSSLNTDEIPSDFINSFQSDFTNISLPRSNVSSGTATTLPLSNSVCDMMVILQRVLGFGKSMFETLSPVERDLGQTTSVYSMESSSTNDATQPALPNRSMTCSLLYSKVLKVSFNNNCNCILNNSLGCCLYICSVHGCNYGVFT